MIVLLNNTAIKEMDWLAMKIMKSLTVNDGRMKVIYDIFLRETIFHNLLYI